jgi:hypothetical protein
VKKFSKTADSITNISEGSHLSFITKNPKIFDLLVIPDNLGIKKIILHQAKGENPSNNASNNHIRN